jgi:hypothetical protein
VLWVNWMREEPLTVVAGNALLSNIIYHQEHFLSVFIQLLKIYNPTKAPLSYAPPNHLYGLGWLTERAFLSRQAAP